MINNTNIYNFFDYKDFLKHRMEYSEPKHGFISKIAKVAGVQRSYLSQVVHGSVHLTMDHAFAISKALHLNSKESEYFFLLVEWARAATPALRNHLLEKIKKLKTEHLDISQHVKSTQLIDLTEHWSVYYSSWHYMAIHTLVSIPQFQKPEAIARRLNLPVELVLTTLQHLQDMGYVDYKKDLWIYIGGHRHLPKTSPFVVLNHNNWRQKSILNSADTSKTQSIHYSSVFTLSRKDLELLRTKLLQWLDETRDLIGPSDCEEMACLNFDLFEV